MIASGYIYFKRVVNSLRCLFSSSFVINGELPYTIGAARNKNLGDDLNIPILNYISEKKLFLYPEVIRYTGENLLAIGSTIENYCNTNTVIWGAGAMYGDRTLRFKPRKVLGVRGPRTRQYLLEQGIECPEIYGDPALILPYLYRPMVEKKYKYGIIPHYIDMNLDIIKKLTKECGDIKIISMRGYDNWKDVINDILSCENIITSSLHGMIISDSYKIPNVRVLFSQNITGGDFKYHDYCEGVGRQYVAPILCYEDINWDLINCILKQYAPIDYNPKELLRVFPYPMSPQAKDLLNRL